MSALESGGTPLGDAAPAALENNREGCSRSVPELASGVVDEEWLARWAKLDYLRTASGIASQRTCLTLPAGDHAAVRCSDSKAHWARLHSCKRRACPVCGPRMAMDDAAEIRRAVEVWRSVGGKIVFGTFTVRHGKSDPLVLLNKHLQAGWRRVTSGARWHEGMRAEGIRGWLRVQEEKWSPRNGFHPHLHYLAFLDPAPWATVDGALRLLDEAYVRFAAGVIAAGGRVPDRAAQDTREVSDDDSAAAVLGSYMTKQAEGRAESSAASIAAELTNRDGKTASRAGCSLTPGDILTLAMADAPGFREVWAEYEASMHRRHVISWAQGFRESLPEPPAGDDAEAVTNDADMGLAEAIGVTCAGFRTLLAKTTRTEVLRRAIGDGVEATREWLRTLGVELADADDTGEGSLSGLDGLDLPF